MTGPRTVSFAIDSGCTTHMVGNKGMVKPYSDHPILHKIRTAEAGRSITATARGSIEHSAGTLEKVLVVDEISRNLLSVSTLADEGHSILFRKNTCHIFNSDNQPVMKGYRKDKEGQTVITKLNANLLKTIASKGNGVFVQASQADIGLGAVLDKINDLDKAQIESKMYTDYEDQFQWFLGLTLLLLTLESFLSERTSEWYKKLNIFGNASK